MEFSLESLRTAIRNSNIDEVKRLTRNRDFSHIMNKNGISPLHWSVDSNNKEITELLIRIGFYAEVNTSDRFGYTPLYWSVINNYKEITELLINSGANVNVINKNYETPLHWSVKCDFKEITELLIKAGADVNAKTIFGCTPLYYYYSNEILELLINAGANVNVKIDTYGNTPLHLSKSKKITELLIKAGADIHAINDNNKTPLDFYRKHNKKIEQIDYLISIIELQKQLWSPERHWIATRKNKEFIHTIMCLNSRNNGLWSTLPLELIYIFFEIFIS